MFNNQLSAVARAARRILPTFGLAASLLASMLGTSVPVFADDPSARLQLVIKRVIVHDDMDWGNGEINIRFEVRTQTGTCAPDDRWGCGPIVVAGRVPQFSATDGWVQTLDRIIPAEGDTLQDSSVGPTIGIPIRPAQWYGLRIVGTESDSFSDDRMGEVRMSITDPDGHVREGDFTRRSDLACTRYPIQMSFCSATADEEVSDPTGAFSVEFQIRRAPLPDLRPVNIKVLDLPGSTNKSVCMAVQNIEPGEPGPFELALQIDGAVPPSGRATAGGLPPGDASERCVQVALPTSGQHRLTAVADEPNTVLEYNETNNVYEQTYTATASAPAPSRALPDLTVKAIKVNGHAPDGKDVCREGKNDVTVVVKNGATTNAGNFLVRLVVDDDDGDLRQKGLDDGLEAGAEREVRFDEVRLKKGPRSLAATADPTIGISESDEGNNTLKVTATCKDDE